MPSQTDVALRALAAIDMLILGSTERARLTQDIRALVAFGLCTKPLPDRLAGWVKDEA